MLPRHENAPRTCLDPGGLSKVSSDPLAVSTPNSGCTGSAAVLRRRLDHADGGVRQRKRRCDHDR